MRIALVIEHSETIELLRQVLAFTPSCEVTWVSQSGADAVRMAARNRPDLILIDPVLPIMSAVSTIGQIMRDSPCAILVVTPSVSTHSNRVFEALGAGALDAVCTPIREADGQISGNRELLAKIHRIEKLIQPRESQPKNGNLRAPTACDCFSLLAIGSSTGGPAALAEILSGLPISQGLSVVIIQHVDQLFSSSLVEWLQSRSTLPITLAEEGKPPKRDLVQLAATNDHLTLGSDKLFHYIREPADFPYRPSVDVFFSSLADNWKRRGCAVLLTGMGRDGAEGLLTLRRSGWHTITQDQKTSVVFGMPKAAQELGAAIEVLPVSEIASAVTRWQTP